MSQDASYSSRQKGKMTKKNARLRRVVFRNDVLPDGTRLAYRICGQNGLIGYKNNRGILCDCCKLVVSPSKFAAHAVFTTNRKPYHYIYTPDGVSLHDLAMRFHEKSAAERVAGTLEADHGGRALCRSKTQDFSHSGFGSRTIINCHQCEKEYHVRCLKDHGVEDLQEFLTGKWLCSKECSGIHSALEELVASGTKILPESLLEIAKTKLKEKGFASTDDLCITWKLLSWRMVPEEAIEDTDKFNPVADLNSSVGDLIPHMVFGRKVRGHDFAGMYCAVLKANSQIVSAGLIRILGDEVAELPLVATSIESQGRGYFKVLFSCVENLLAALKVKKLVVPVPDKTESLWTKFGFNKVGNEELMHYQKKHHMMVFQRTTMFQKSVVSS